ncbi:alpha-galactosidase [Massilia sp. Root133]|uniref:glycoside hydrolase family 27 protein n=1 Tax=unclassified Massilia TaxID=2609279 RepID=UPI0006F39FA2|nr:MULTISPECIES: glycoside hydrolase family 27 protein [unclassified Massilia]KQY00993.1 alpha-galactosidase [Massilia sp. Root133]KQZ52977.1 alpha-galactosidase [Massilia sp. Root1485]
MDSNRRRILTASLAAAAAAGVPSLAFAAKSKSASAAAGLAPTPPMGWNSWNSFGPTITEAQALENADIMVAKLLPFGYNVFTVDIQWYEPNANSYEYRKDAELTMDQYGRLQPAPNRFPSAANGAGFKKLADQIHARGMKFGIHLMRGIPRQAVRLNTTILGTSLRAQDIADTKAICEWNGDMYGVDMTKPGAQEYYNSVFKQYAAWGVDFVKMDDMSRPYVRNWPEVEAAHKAIAASGRPIVLSLSPGEMDLRWANHVPHYAQMWRISDDFWDEWRLLNDQFQRLENWNPVMGANSWPDADMLPLGRLALGARDTKFTPDEQQTLMSLWSIARSPLIMGGDLRHLDAKTLALLTNPEVLAVNQRSRDNHPHRADAGTRIWSARSADKRNLQYLALFNTSDAPTEIVFDLSRLDLGNRSVAVRDLWARRDQPAVRGALRITLAPHASTLLGLSA